MPEPMRRSASSRRATRRSVTRVVRVGPVSPYPAGLREPRSLPIGRVPAKTSLDNEPRFFSADCRTKQWPIVCGETPGAEVVMKHRSELVPLAVLGSLTAAIMVVFAVTVMH
jgi:hypothetical protein